MVKLHLFSTPGNDNLRDIIEASRPYLEGKSDARIAYMPLASLFVERWPAFTKDVFKNLASVDLVNMETMTLPGIQDTLWHASLLYIPDGNSSIMGIGAAERANKVRWNMAGNIITAWVLTIPATTFVVASIYLLANRLVF
ncbi:MAG: inorganic phosphate transporter [Chloroflexota bacterium]